MFVSAAMNQATGAFELEVVATIDCTDGAPMMGNKHEKLEDCLKGSYFKSYTYRLFEVSLTSDDEGYPISLEVHRAIPVEFVKRGEIRLA